MLRISLIDAPQSTRLKLEGKLANEWVAELETAWTGLAATRKNKVTVDLADVSFVDDHGKELLTLIHRAGTELVGSGPMVAALIEEIHEKLAKSRSALRKEAVSLLVILMFLFVVACSR
jgi:anti-anti-sigma regulatory factor